MASINKVILVGHLGRDPENRYLPSGEQVTSIAVDTTDRWRDKATGDMKEQTEWHRISFFGKLAEIAGQYLKKGAQVYVEGRIRINRYKDKDGVDRQQVQIVANTLQMLGSRQDMDSQPPSRPARNAYAEAKQTGNRPAPAPIDDIDDDIPF